MFLSFRLLSVGLLYLLVVVVVVVVEHHSNYRVSSPALSCHWLLRCCSNRCDWLEFITKHDNKLSLFFSFTLKVGSLLCSRAFSFSVAPLRFHPGQCRICPVVATRSALWWTDNAYHFNQPD
jgi:hypothetical protein